MSRPVARLDRPYSCPSLKTEALPFHVRLATGLADIERIAKQRGQAYNRHQPDLVRQLSLHEPEKDDLRLDAVHLMAENGAGELVGSMRLTTNINTPLRFEREFNLPPSFKGKSLLEAGRMTSANGPSGKMVVSALIKFAFEISYRAGIDHLMLIARAPIDRIYRALTFQDVFDGQKVETSAQPGVPVTLFHIHIPSVDQQLRDAHCPYYEFLALTHHPDASIDYEKVHRRFNQPLPQGLSDLSRSSTQSPAHSVAERN
jgi:predicted GNAT family N-acyltransferase